VTLRSARDREYFRREFERIAAGLKDLDELDRRLDPRRDAHRRADHRRKVPA
jgi:hypothetical protein